MKKNSRNTTSIAHAVALRSCLCLNFRKTARLVTQVYDRALRPVGITGTQFSLLGAIKAIQPTNVSTLAKISAMDRTTLTRNLNLLKKRGWISLQVGEDHRERMITLSGNGKEKLGEAMPLWRKTQERMVNAIGETKWSDLRGDMEKISRICAGG